MGGICRSWISVDKFCGSRIGCRDKFCICTRLYPSDANLRPQNVKSKQTLGQITMALAQLCIGREKGRDAPCRRPSVWGIQVLYTPIPSAEQTTGRSRGGGNAIVTEQDQCIGRALLRPEGLSRLCPCCVARAVWARLCLSETPSLQCSCWHSAALPHRTVVNTPTEYTTVAQTQPLHFLFYSVCAL